MAETQTLVVPIEGMDCAECTLHVQAALAKLPGVNAVDVFLAAEKAVIQLDPDRVDLPAIRDAVSRAGYQVGEAAAPSAETTLRSYSRHIPLTIGVFWSSWLICPSIAMCSVRSGTGR